VTRRISGLLFAALFCLLLSAQNSKPGVFDGVVRSAPNGTRQAYLPVVFPSSHARNLLFLPNGDLLCTWFSGSAEGQSDVAIVLSRLDKGSGQWTKPAVLAHESKYSFQNPVLFRAPNGKLWLFHTAQLAGKGQSNSIIEFMTSTDNGRTWTHTEPLFTQPGSYDRQPAVVTGKEWILPIYYTPSRGIIAGAENNYSAMKITSDGGAHWRECEVPDSKGLVQPSVLKLAPHRFIAFFRSRFADWIYKSESDDGCKWAAPVATHLPNNNASIQAALLSDGHVVMAFNNSNASAQRGKPASGPRKPLSVALSVDGGKTWPWVRDVETGLPGKDAEYDLPDKVGHDEYSYPSIKQGPDGDLHMSYTFRRATIKYVTFSEDWIREGGTAGKFKGDSRPVASKKQE
jgi:predicted neuraminidase